MLVFVLYVLALGIPVVSGSDNTGLKFGNDGYSIISFQPDMASLSEKFTFCLWIRTKTSESTQQMPFAYEQGELFIDSIKNSNNGRYRLFSSTGYISSEHIPVMGTWYQYCGTWSLASRTFRAYVNGTLASTLITAAGRKLKTGGTFVLGDYRDTVAAGSLTNCDFGGEMYNLNLYSKELTGTEIAALSADGLCTPLPDQLDEYRLIRWEEVLKDLKLTRKGTVQDIQTGCGDFETELGKTQRLLQEAISEKEELQASLTVLENSSLELNESKLLLKHTVLQLNEIKGVLENSSLELNKSKAELENSLLKLNESQIELENTKLELKTALENECELRKGHLTKWDVLYSCPYYNKVFTRKLHKRLRTTWGSLTSKGHFKKSNLITVYRN